jgi:hypothetical protein
VLLIWKASPQPAPGRLGAKYCSRSSFSSMIGKFSRNAGSGLTRKKNLRVRPVYRCGPQPLLNAARLRERLRKTQVSKIVK